MSQFSYLTSIFLLGSILGSAGVDAQFRHGIVDKNSGTGGLDIVAVGDINGDGLDDIVSAAKAGGQVIWYENPSLARHEIYKASFKWSCDAEIADVNGDKKNDIVLVSWYESKHYWLENPGQKGGAWKLHLIGGGIKGHDIEAADLDKDGLMDVIVRSETWPDASAKEIQIWKQTAANKWTNRPLTTIEGGGIRLGDVDRDQDMDIIAAGRWYENDGKSILDGAWKEHVFDAKSTMYNKIEFADLNGDGLRDIVMTPSETHGSIKERGPVVWYEASQNAATGKWAKHIVDSDNGDLHSLGVADLDHDGSPDIFTANMHTSAGAHEVLIYRNNGRGMKWTKEVLATTGSHQATVFDLGGDGDYDVVGANYNTNIVELWENRTILEPAKHFVFFDETVVHTGKERLWEDWDFIVRQRVKSGSPKNWMSPVNFAEGSLRFRVEVLEMAEVDSAVSVAIGWHNSPKDFEIRHAAGASIFFIRPGIYERTVPIKEIQAWYGAGPRENAECFDFDWKSAFAEDRFFTYIRPRANKPGKDGFPIKLRATITVFAKGEQRNVEITEAAHKKQFVFFDKTILHTGQKRDWEDWDFVDRLPLHPGAPRNWVQPVNYREGWLKFRAEVLEMQPIAMSASIQMGWENVPKGRLKNNNSQLIGSLS